MKEKWQKVSKEYQDSRVPRNAMIQNTVTELKLMLFVLNKKKS
jgi:hypothetical protein